MMKTIPADERRHVHLPGVGDVARPVDIERSNTGLGLLKSLRIYRFAAGQIIDGEAEEDEVCIVFMSGEARFEIGTDHRWDIRGRASVFGGAPHVAYLPPHHSYRLTPYAETEVAYARASARGRRPPRLLRPEDMAEQTEGDGLIRTMLGPADAEQLQCSERILTDVKAVTFTDSRGEHFRHVRFSRVHQVAQVLSSSEAAFPLKHRDTIVSAARSLTLTLPAECNTYLLHVFVPGEDA